MTAIRLEVQRQNLRISNLQKVSTRKERVDSKPKDVDNSGDSKKNGGKSSEKSIWKNFLQKVKAVWDFGQKNLPENQVQKIYDRRRMRSTGDSDLQSDRAAYTP